MADKNGPLWEVFIRTRNGMAHRHAGSVHDRQLPPRHRSRRAVYPVLPHVHDAVQYVDRQRGTDAQPRSYPQGEIRPPGKNGTGKRSPCQEA